MGVDREALAARAAILGKEIQLLENRLGPLRDELNTINRKIAGTKLGRLSVEHRRQAVGERDLRICEEARTLGARQTYIPIFWQQLMATKYELSPRQIRRILKRADIKVER